MDWVICLAIWLILLTILIWVIRHVQRPAEYSLQFKDINMDDQIQVLNLNASTTYEVEIRESDETGAPSEDVINGIVLSLPNGGDATIDDNDDSDNISVLVTGANVGETFRVHGEVTIDGVALQADADVTLVAVDVPADDFQLVFRPVS